MKKFGFARKERLKKSGEFLRILRGAKRARGEFLTLASRQHSDSSSSLLRLGIIVPKRVFKRAHDRNQMKRWVREAFRLTKPSIRPGFDLVVSVSASPAKPDFHSVKDELIFLLKKAELIS